MSQSSRRNLGIMHRPEVGSLHRKGHASLHRKGHALVTKGLPLLVRRRWLVITGRFNGMPVRKLVPHRPQAG